MKISYIAGQLFVYICFIQVTKIGDTFFLKFILPSFFHRLFGQRCAKCDQTFLKNDFVMRARDNAYHIDCFRCVACSRQLIPGDEFALREDGLFCKADHDVVERANSIKDENSDCESSPSTKSVNSLNNNNNNSNTNNNNLDKTKSNIINNNIKNEKGLSSSGKYTSNLFTNSDSLVLLIFHELLFF